ncbi:MAG TPA: iron ABC transporter permease [Methanoregulaceae archaeon]|nr:iron ABC transporter permease [Methanoregulaceae archaeon]HQJ87625.1 iron ABC transporter permease [Methanoregulaceae archaeon]
MHLDGATTDLGDRYSRYIRAKQAFLLGALGLLVVLIIVSIAVGSVVIPFDEVIATLAGGAGGDTATIVWQIRLPRVLAAVVAGGGLGVAGTVMQSVLRNPLSSPYTLGVSHAAGFGAAVAITLLGAGAISSHVEDSVVVQNPGAVTICAFVASMAATVLLLLIARIRSSQPEVMVLVGVALGALFTAGTTFLQYFSSADQVAAIVFWTFGDVGRAGWPDLVILLAVVLPCLGWFILNRWNYTTLDAGDETARSLGVGVERVRVAGMLLSSLITAVVVSFLGIIGFIGLVSPHMVRRLIGDDQRFLIPGSCLVGGIVLLVSDTLARLVLAPVVLPVGILTAFFGAPLFLYLLIRGYRR